MGVFLQTKNTGTIEERLHLVEKRLEYLYFMQNVPMPTKEELDLIEIKLRSEVEKGTFKRKPYVSPDFNDWMPGDC